MPNRRNSRSNAKQITCLTEAVVRRTQKVTALVLFVSLLTYLLPNPVHAAAGSLDSAFGTGGKIVTDFAGGYDFARAVVVQSDGKIIAAGSSGLGDYGLIRYNSDGTLDSTFGSKGRVTTDFGGTDTANALAVQSDGKIVVAGQVETEEAVDTEVDFGLVRYSADGQLDPSFGAGGRVTTDFGGLDEADVTDDMAYDMAIQPDGKIVVAGTTFTKTGNDFAIARYNSNGTLDASFGDGGKVLTDFGSLLDEGKAIAIQADGKIVMVGSTRTASSPAFTVFALVRYHTEGTLDSTFGDNGKVTTSFAASDSQVIALAMQPNGKIVVAGYSSPLKSPTSCDFALARYNTDGTLDSTFGVNGKVTTDFGNIDMASAVAIQGDGRIVMTGTTYPTVSLYHSDFALVRYNSDGTLDSAFGSKGKVTTDFTTIYARAIDAAIAPNGELVVVGDTFNDTTFEDFALARYQLGTTNPPPAAANTSPNQAARGAAGPTTDSPRAPGRREAHARLL